MAYQMIEIFLTAYDRSDLPGSSIDPLGFERGYLLLADKILPGLTNAASHPRYFALICAGIDLSGDTVDPNRRELVRKHRQETILRLERFWGLANVLARPDNSGGVRGVTYAQAWAEELLRSGATRTTAKYPLLSRQSQYGAIGMYANVASGMRFLNREDFTLTPALGEIAAEAFQDETKLPPTLRRAILDDGDVSLATLKAWGEQAHVEAEVKIGEARCLFDAQHSNPIRSRTTGLLRRHPRKNDQETELSRLARVVQFLRGTSQNQDLREAIECILEFESCYQIVTLAMERLLWLCRHHAAAAVTFRELNSDPILATVMKEIPTRTERFLNTINNGTEAAFRHDLDRLSDVRRFLEDASIACGNAREFIEVVINRHTDIQRGKFDRGRRKMPWLECDDTRINLTMTRAGGRNSETTLPEQIEPHPYRVQAADALSFASAKAAQL
ncbi:hypothetical protein SBA4_3460013 [Candidatus Sulfopaludibacter sp. SbA4]|nr:hypothetical protein SBA4_3460013 [Candidatus Sulfopaludibacter sp. SbA4]